MFHTQKEGSNTCTGQNMNNNNISYRGLLCHPLGRFSLGSIYMLIPYMFSNLLGSGKGMIAFWTCKACIGHHV